MCAHKGLCLTLPVNGFSVNACYSPREEIVMTALLERIMNLKKTGLRKIVFLAGPPGAGKSTLCLSLAALARMKGFTQTIACAGLDGFHMRREKLNVESALIDGRAVPLYTVKGRPETFETEAFSLAVREAKNAESVLWPVYDRTLHEVSDLREDVSSDILLVEGNWLLSDAPKWARAREAADFTVALLADRQILKPRLVERKMRGGKSAEEAEEWFEKVDGPNIELFEKTRVKADAVLRITADGLTEIR